MKRVTTNMFGYTHIKVLCYQVIILFVLISTTKESAAAQQLGKPAIDFTRHTVVQPIVHHGKTKREISTTRNRAGEHHKQVSMTVVVDGEEYVLDLVLNEELVSKDHVISYQKNGETVLHKPTKEELDICQYSGTVRGKPGSWVALSTCRGISGVIHDGNTVKYIEPATGNALDSQHFMYDQSDLNATHHSGYNIEHSSQLLEKHLWEQSWDRSRISRYKREANNTNNEMRYMELMLVADNQMYRAHGEKIPNVVNTFQDITNVLNSIYAPFSISIILVSVMIWSERDEIHLDQDSSVTLVNFLSYGPTRFAPMKTIDHPHLVTYQRFSNRVVGLAVGSPVICSEYLSGGVTSRYTELNSMVASTIAHEIGHNFNILHDTPDCKCPNEMCIMGYANHFRAYWSSCSLKSMESFFKHGDDHCLRSLVYLYQVFINTCPTIVTNHFRSTVNVRTTHCD